MKKYIVDTINKKDFTAGSKARIDINNILINEGFNKVNIEIGSNKKNLLIEIPNIKKQLIALLNDVESNSLMVFQYPWNTLSFGMAKIISTLASERNIKTIIVIHDLNSIRTGSKLTRFYYDNFVKEICYLDQFDRIICHNESMKRYLIRHGIKKSKINEIGIFDYVTDNRQMDVEPSEENIRTVNIAGNLSVEKSGYLYKLHDIDDLHFTVELYGPYYNGKNTRNLHYNGSFAAEELPEKINHGFGLIWDGDSLDTCSGHFGEYLKYNNPHKLSLYMACNIPVIVWKQSAISNFVELNSIGFSIDRISDINYIMDNITIDKYNKIKANVSRIHTNVLNGYYIKRSVNNCISDILAN